MVTSSRDRISVDLRGLKSALNGRAEALGVSPSALVRNIIATSLDERANQTADPFDRPRLAGSGNRVRLCLRLRRDEAAALLANARRAGLSAGDFVSGVLAEVPVLSAGTGRPESIAALMTSNAELATLGRHLHRLAAALRQANVEAARPYRQMLDTLAGDVARHLKLAASGLADLQPRGRVGRSASTASD